MRTYNDYLKFVAQHIPLGHDNAATSEQLACSLGLSSHRRMRKIFMDLAYSGVDVVLNLQDGRGYFRSNNITELDRFIQQEENRANAILCRANAAKEKRDKLLIKSKQGGESF